eukprot:jgi/Mesvir1/15924/Mv08248-RA.1
MGILRGILTLLGLFKVKAEILVIGLENSGKSTIVNTLRAEKARMLEIAPTVGFSIERLQLGRCQLTVMDMSGQPVYLKLWQCYYQDANAIVFVVDAADPSRLDTARGILQAVLEHPDTARRPLLVFANKMDLVHALQATQVAEQLHLDSVREREWHISAACGMTGEGIEEGMRWLTDRLQGT